MSYVSKNPRFTTTSITDSTTGSISSPPSGVDKIINRNGVLYLKNSAGGETPIGSSSGGKNYLAKQSDASAAVGTVSVVAAGGDISVSGTFPNVSSAWYADAGAAAIAISSDNTLRGTSNYLTALTSFSAAGAVYVQTPVFNIDGEDLGKALAVQFDVAGNTTADDWDVVAVRYTSAGVFGALIPIAGIASTTTGTASAQVPTGTTTFRGFFITGSTASDVYSIRWRRRAGAVAIRFDNLIVGPNSVMLGTAITDWQSYTPTVTGQGTITLTYAQYRRVGSNLEVRAKWTAGTVDGTSLTVSLPTGLNVSTSADALGTGGMVTSYAGAAQGGIFPLLSSSNTAAVFWTHNNSRSGLTALAGNGITQNSSVVTCTFQAPITNWSSNVTMADRAVEEYASNLGTAGGATSDTTAFTYGAAGAQIGTITATLGRRVRFQTVIQPTDFLIVEVSTDRIMWFPMDGQQVVNGAAVDPVILQGTTRYGMGRLEKVNSTDVDVLFCQYVQANGATFGAAGGNWVSAGAGYWRVRKVSGGAAVGFPIAPANITLIDSADNYAGNTKLGLMQYKHGTSYNGGIAPTVTGQAGFALSTSAFIPYQMSDLTWRMRFNISFTQTSGTAADVAVAGVSAVLAGVAGRNLSSGTSQTSASMLVADIVIRSTVAGTNFAVGGDVTLNSKPTWAY
jgi:hypothetical protein